MAVDVHRYGNLTMAKDLLDYLWGRSLAHEQRSRSVAAVMMRYEGHRDWVNYLAVFPDCRKSGYGRRLMEETEARMSALGCPKINLQIRSSNAYGIEFYERIGFSVGDVVSMGRRLEED